MDGHPGLLPLIRAGGRTESRLQAGSPSTARSGSAANRVSSEDRRCALHVLRRLEAQQVQDGRTGIEDVVLLAAGICTDSRAIGDEHPFRRVLCGVSASSAVTDDNSRVPDGTGAPIALGVGPTQTRGEIIF